MKLPDDAARCDGELGNCCEIAGTCRRWLDRDSGRVKSAFYREGWPFKKFAGDCKYYLPVLNEIKEKSC